MLPQHATGEVVLVMFIHRFRQNKKRFFPSDFELAKCNSALFFPLFRPEIRMRDSPQALLSLSTVRLELTTKQQAIRPLPQPTTNHKK